MKYKAAQYKKRDSLYEIRYRTAASVPARRFPGSRSRLCEWAIRFARNKKTPRFRGGVIA